MLQSAIKTPHVKNSSESPKDSPDDQPHSLVTATEVTE